MRKDFLKFRIERYFIYLYLIKYWIYFQYLRQLDLEIGEGSEVNFKYDVLGRRIEKSKGSDITKYFYAGKRVIEERDSSNVVLKQYFYGNGIDEVLRMDRNESDVMVPYYYHSNGTGSVTAITDGSGNLIERLGVTVLDFLTLLF